MTRRHKKQARSYQQALHALKRSGGKLSAQAMARFASMLHDQRAKIGETTQRYLAPFTEVTRESAPDAFWQDTYLRGWINDLFLVIEREFDYRFGQAAVHLMVQRCDGGVDVGWWDLQNIKERFYPGRTAIEIFPAQADVLDDSNIRHLWIGPEGTSLNYGLHCDLSYRTYSPPDQEKPNDGQEKPNDGSDQAERDDPQATPEAGVLEGDGHLHLPFGGAERPAGEAAQAPDGQPGAGDPAPGDPPACLPDPQGEV